MPLGLRTQLVTHRRLYFMNTGGFGLISNWVVSFKKSGTTSISMINLTASAFRNMVRLESLISSGSRILN